MSVANERERDRQSEPRLEEQGKVKQPLRSGIKSSLSASNESCLNLQQNSLLCLCVHQQNQVTKSDSQLFSRPVSQSVSHRASQTLNCDCDPASHRCAVDIPDPRSVGHAKLSGASVSSLVVAEVVRHQKGHSEKTRRSIKSRMDAVCVDSGLQLGPLADPPSSKASWPRPFKG